MKPEELSLAQKLVTEMKALEEIHESVERHGLSHRAMLSLSPAVRETIVTIALADLTNQISKVETQLEKMGVDMTVEPANQNEADAAEQIARTIFETLTGARIVA